MEIVGRWKERFAEVEIACPVSFHILFNKILQHNHTYYLLLLFCLHESSTRQRQTFIQASLVKKGKEQVVISCGDKVCWVCLSIVSSLSRSKNLCRSRYCFSRVTRRKRNNMPCLCTNRKTGRPDGQLFDRNKARNKPWKWTEKTLWKLLKYYIHSTFNFNHWYYLLIGYEKRKIYPNWV